MKITGDGCIPPFNQVSFLFGATFLRVFIFLFYTFNLDRQLDYDCGLCGKLTKSKAPRVAGPRLKEEQGHCDDAEAGEYDGEHQEILSGVAWRVYRFFHAEWFCKDSTTRSGLFQGCKSNPLRRRDFSFFRLKATYSSFGRMQ